MAPAPLVVCGIGVLGVLGLVGCEEYGARVYSARPYRAESHCLGPYVPIGVVRAGALPSTCAARCWMVDATLYVSVVCEPHPARAVEVTPGDSSDCASAIALLESGPECSPPLSDAGAGGDAADDASAPPG